MGLLHARHRGNMRTEMNKTVCLGKKKKKGEKIQFLCIAKQTTSLFRTGHGQG